MAGQARIAPGSPRTHESLTSKAVPRPKRKRAPVLAGRALIIRPLLTDCPGAQELLGGCLLLTSFAGSPSLRLFRLVWVGPRPFAPFPRSAEREGIVVPVHAVIADNGTGLPHPYPSPSQTTFGRGEQDLTHHR